MTEPPGSRIRLSRPPRPKMLLMRNPQSVELEIKVHQRDCHLDNQVETEISHPKPLLRSKQLIRAHAPTRVENALRKRQMKKKQLKRQLKKQRHYQMLRLRRLKKL